MTRQTFGSALLRPWALVKFGSNQPNGRRPGTSVAYLTDDEGDHYLGGYVEFGRDRCWHYRYQHAKRIPKSDVLHIFWTMSKSSYGGPRPAELISARKAVPVTEVVS
jgi:hypothetical protein